MRQAADRAIAGTGPARGPALQRCSTAGHLAVSRRAHASCGPPRVLIVSEPRRDHHRRHALGTTDSPPRETTSAAPRISVVGMKVLAVAFLVLGTALELLALDLARRDLRDAHDAEERRKAGLPSMMAAGKHTVSAWITEATGLARRGCGCHGRPRAAVGREPGRAGIAPAVYCATPCEQPGGRVR